MLFEESVIDVGGTKFRGIVEKNFLKVRIIMGEKNILFEFKKGNKRYRTRVPVSIENAQRAWRTIFPGSSIPDGVIITTAEEERMDARLGRGLFDLNNMGTNFIGARF